MHKNPCICCKRGASANDTHSCGCCCYCRSCTGKTQVRKLSTSHHADGETAKMLSQAPHEANHSSTDSRPYDRDTTYNVDRGSSINGEKFQSLERHFMQIESHVREVQKDMRHIVNTIDGRERQLVEARRVTREWKEVARVLDRFFVILYLSIIIFSLLTLFPRPNTEPWCCWSSSKLLCNSIAS